VERPSPASSARVFCSQPNKARAARICSEKLASTFWHSSPGLTTARSGDCGQPHSRSVPITGINENDTRLRHCILYAEHRICIPAHESGPGLESLHGDRTHTGALGQFGLAPIQKTSSCANLFCVEHLTYWIQLATFSVHTDLKGNHRC
jgi:hypothetical protein